MRTLAIVFLLLACLPAQETEQSELQTWCRDLAAKDSRVWSAAMAELVELGDRAVPAMRQIVRRADGTMPEDARRAVQVLHRIGAPAAATIPDLIGLLGRLDLRDGHRSVVILAVGELVPHAPRHREAVREAMFDLLANERHDRLGRILQIGNLFDKYRVIARTEFGPDTDADELGMHLSADNPFVREFAAEMLASKPTSSGSEANIKALLQAMRGPHPGKVQLEGFPPFEVFLDRRIQAAAARALAQVAPKDPRSVAAFALLMERPNRAERLAAVAAARHTGAAGAALLPQLMRMAANDAPIIRREVITTLGTLGPVAAPAAELLEQLSKDPDPQIARRAQAALRQVRQ